MSELFKLNVNGILYRLVFKLNERTNISAKTAVGKSDTVKC